MKLTFEPPTGAVISKAFFAVNANISFRLHSAGAMPVTPAQQLPWFECIEGVEPIAFSLARQGWLGSLPKLLHYLLCDILCDRRWF